VKIKLNEIKNSIQFKLTLILTGLVMIIIFLLWLLNLTMFPAYYQNSKIKTLQNTYDRVISLLSLTDYRVFPYQYNKDIRELDRISANNDLSIYACDSWSYVSHKTEYRQFSFYYPFDISRDKKQIMSEMIGPLVDSFEKGEKIQDGGTSILLRSKLYNIYKIYDDVIESNYIVLLGRVDNNNYVYIRLNAQGMQQNIASTNKFFGYLGLIMALIGSVVMYFVSKSFATPILKLADIANSMSNLNFDVRYIEKRDDEIGQLGKSMNVLSEKLESTICELKTANNELRIENERKTEIDEMRKEFLSNVSHELKTPIALIQGYAEGLIDNVNSDPESRDFYCEVIVDEAQKMNKMVKKLLTLNQLEFGNNFAQIEYFDMSQVINSVLSSTAILFEQKGVHLEYNDSVPRYVWSDEYLVEEVLTNFVSNALNHVCGENLIRISVEQKTECLRVSVFNTGNQIPEEELEKIWIKFYKVDKARTREYGGNGIGLSIVSAIMKSLNQEFGVYNVENGVVFWFDIDTKNK